MNLCPQCEALIMPNAEELHNMSDAEKRELAWKMREERYSVKFIMEYLNFTLSNVQYYIRLGQRKVEAQDMKTRNAILPRGKGNE